MNISNIQIHKRTFEGKQDKTKNDSAITSEYRPSRKYAVSYDIENYPHNPTIRCFTTKSKANEYVEELKIKHNITQN